MVIKNILYIIPGVIFVIIIIIAGVIVYFFVCRSRHKNSNTKCTSATSKDVEMGCIKSMSRHKIRTDKHNTANMYLEGPALELQTWVPKPGVKARRYPPVDADHLLEEYALRGEHGDKLFNEEFGTIPYTYPQYNLFDTDAEENRSKNRYPKKIVPLYEYNRVILKSSSNDDNFNNYINATYVKKSDETKEYVVAQAPMESTMVDFWRMVYDHHATIIVMLCNLFYDGREMSFKYWPDKKTRLGVQLYGPFKVKHVGSKPYADHTVRTFTLHNVILDEEPPRRVTHFQFKSWLQREGHEFNKVPRVQAQFMKFLEKIKKLEKSASHNVPVIVHCCGGTSGSGMYIALDQLMEQLDQKKRVDIYTCVSHLRQQRPFMVHYPGQYKYLFNSLLERHLYGNTEMSVFTLRNKAFGRETSFWDQVNQQFEALRHVTVQNGPKSIGLREEHLRKNNYPDLIIPFDDNMVTVSPRPGQPDTTYINASWIDGFWEERAYIVTQDPQQETVHEFWRMVWEHDVSAVVMLTEPRPRAAVFTNQCYHYWPYNDERAVCYDQIVIRHEPTKHQECPGYSVRTFAVYSKTELTAGTRTIYQFHFHDWPVDSVPSSAMLLLDMIAQLRAVTPRTQPIAIHCSGGGDRSSVFCAINLLVDQLEDAGKFDIFQTTRLLRHQRPHMIPTIVEYEFLWKAVLQHLDTCWTDQEQNTRHLVPTK